MAGNCSQPWGLNEGIQAGAIAPFDELPVYFLSFPSRVDVFLSDSIAF